MHNDQSSKRHSYDARLGAGLTKDGKTLYVMLVQNGAGKTGLSYQMCARVFKALGCSDAMEFDGGSSAELFVNGSSLTGEAITVSQAAMMGFFCN